MAMKATDFKNKLADLEDILEDTRADIDSLLNQWEGEEMDDEQKATILYYRKEVEELQNDLDIDEAANNKAVEEETAVTLDGEDTPKTKEA